MLTLRGAPALSDFCNQRLLSRLQSELPSIKMVYAEFVHFVLVDGDLARADAD